MTILQKQYQRLKGKTAWILGGKRIGQTVARALAEQGVHLIVNYMHSRSEAEKTAAAAKRLGVRTMVVQSDASSPASVGNAIKAFQPEFPHIDILINMPSVFESVKLEKITPLDWHRNIAAHILGSYWPTQMALPLMKQGAHVINISDRTSIGPVYKNYLPYVVTKGAVDHMTRALATELAPRGIFVNAIAPGPILPPDSFSAKSVNALRNNSPLKFPMNSTETLEQFAILVLYLSTVTLTSGSTYSLDQGQNL